MCGIFGARTSRSFVELYLLNRERGDFSYGGLYYKKDLITIIKNNVDSSCIPFLLSKGNQYIEEDAIKWTLEQLDGIYACWMFNLYSSNLYLVRCGSPIFYDCILKQFSSISNKSANDVLLKEGLIYKSNSYFDEPQVMGEFKFNSPYLTS